MALCILELHDRKNCDAFIECVTGSVEGVAKFMWLTVKNQRLGKIVKG